MNANLWAGLALLAVSAAFLVWARLRPIVVPDDIDRGPRTPRPALSARQAGCVSV